MRTFPLAVCLAAALVPACAPAAPPAAEAPAAPAAVPAPPDGPDPDVAALVGRLDLEAYKTTILGLTRFGDRLEGTDRNQAAVDWIAEQLAAYGCAPERMTYEVAPPEPAPQAATGAAPVRRNAFEQRMTEPGEFRPGQGGSRLRGMTRNTAPNTDPDAQPDAALRALNAQPSSPGVREQVYCTKVGATRPDEMYILGAHMDGRGFGEAANDDGSGTALVMELARVLSAPDVETDRSIRFILFNSEEVGSLGAAAYVAARQALQGLEAPEGSGAYPEPRWLGMLQHDMMLFDHGMPGPDGALPAAQRPEADVNVEFQAASAAATGSMALATYVRGANERYATDYPAAIGSHMSNTDSRPFQDLIPSVSLRENERGMHVGAGWNPHWHQATDRFETFTDDDFRLGLNAAQTTLGAVAELAGARLVR